MLVARDLQVERREWFQAYDAFLAATLAHSRYLLASGRLTDPESQTDIAALEEEHHHVRLHLGRLRAETQGDGTWLQLPQDPGRRLSLAARRELRTYREAVCADARRLRAHSSALQRRCREARRRLRVADGPR